MMTEARRVEVAPPLLRIVAFLVDGLIVAPVNGLLFRVWFGQVVPGPLHRTAFYPSADYPVFSTHCWDVVGDVFGHLFPE